MTKFSILVLLYKSDPKSVLLTLKSAVLQKNDDFEIVISDDGTHSVDIPGIDSFFAGYGFTNYKILDNDENKGTVCHIYEALKHCSGKYIKPIGAGDLLYDENVLDKMWDFMEKDNKKFAFGRLQAFCFEDGKLTFNTFCNPPMNKEPYVNGNDEDIYRSVLFQRDYVSGASLFIEKETFVKYLGEVKGKIRYAEDYIQLLATVDGERIKMLDDYVVYYESASGISRDAASGNPRLDPDRKMIWEIIEERTTDPKLKKNIATWKRLKKVKNNTLRSGLRILIFPSAFIYNRRRKASMRNLKVRNCGFLATDDFAQV